jgi:hypothetical protein
MAKNMTAEDIMAALQALNPRRINSGVVRNLSFALTPYRGHSTVLDKQIDQFETARVKFEYRAVRGHKGAQEWERIVECATPMKETLRIVTSMLK